MASNMNGSTHKPITSAAKVSAAVIAQLRASGQPLTSGDLMGHSSVQEIGLSDNSFYANISTMKKAGLIRRVPVVREDQPGVKYGFELADGEIIAKRVKKPKSGPVIVVAKPLTKPVAKSTGPAIKVDFVKSSGRLRIELNGMFLEIGVIE